MVQDSMTSYILHGGATSKASPHNDDFFKQFTAGIEKDPVSILLCYWSRPKDQWEKLKQRDCDHVLKHGNKDATLDITESATDFPKKAQVADVIYFTGGTYETLYQEAKKIKDTQKLFQNKLVIGSSAGAFLLCSFSLNSFDTQPTDYNHGLKLLPISLLCHWDIEDKKQQKINTLKKVSPTLPILTLDETKYIRIFS